MGFLETHCHETDPDMLPVMPNEERSPSVFDNSIQVLRLHVMEHMHHGGVSRRLIRRIIEEGNEQEVQCIWLEATGELFGKTEEKFKRTGFIALDRNRLCYEFEPTDHHEKELHPWECDPRCWDAG